MNKTATTALIFGLALSAAGCGGMHATEPIMRAAPGDPVGSANTGTGSVTVGGTIPEEAKSSGIAGP